MKKILKNRIFIFIISGLIFGSIGVYATTLYSAEQVSYKSTNVKEALDYLYDNSFKLQEFTGSFSLVPITSDGGCVSRPYNNNIEGCYSSRFDVNVQGYSTLKVNPSSLYTSYDIYLDNEKIHSVSGYAELTFDVSNKSKLTFYSPGNSYTNRGQGTYTLIP